MTKHRWVALLAAAPALLSASCSFGTPASGPVADASPSPTKNEVVSQVSQSCTTAIWWDGREYELRKLTVGFDPSGERIGRAEIFACDGSHSEPVEVFAVEGVEVEDAVFVGGFGRMVATGRAKTD